MKKRILTLVLALVMIIPLAIACTPTEGPDKESESASQTTPQTGGGPTEQETDPVDTSPETDEYGRLAIPADYLDEVNIDGTLTMLAWDDYSMQEFEGTGDKGEEIDSAIYRRNEAVERKLNVKIEYIPQPSSAGSDMTDYVARVANDFSDGGKAQYDMFASYSRTLPVLAIAGYTQNLHELEYFNFEADWWLDDLAEECSVAGELHFISGDISTNFLWMTMAMFFNKALLVEYNIELPYELVKEKKWTFEAFSGIVADIWEDVDGAGSATDDDLFGFAGTESSMDTFGAAGGFAVVTIDDNGKYIIDPDFYNEDMVIYLETLNEFVYRRNGVYNPKDMIARDIFMDSRALFTIDRLFIAAGKDNHETGTEGIAFDFGVCPVPMWKEEQGRYYTQVGHPFTMYGISRKTTLKNECAAYLELTEAEAYRFVTPAIFYTAMKIRYSDDPVASEMYDIIRETTTFERGRIWCSVISSSASNAFRKGFLTTSVSTTKWKLLKNEIQQGLDDINEAWGFEK